MAETFPLFQKGPLRQSYPTVQFTQGYDPMGTRNRAAVAPVKSGETLKSGMVACLVYNTGTQQEEWVPGLTANRQPYVIETEPSAQDSQAVGGLVRGISLSDAVSFETAFFVAGTVANWDSGREISAYAAGDGNAGKFKLAASGEAIVGVCGPGHINGLIDRADQHYHVTRDGDGKVLVAHIQAAFVPGNLLA